MTRGVLVRSAGGLALVGVVALATAHCSSRKCESYLFRWTRNVSGHVHDECTLIVENEYASAEYVFPSLDEVPGCRDADAGCPVGRIPDSTSFPLARCTKQTARLPSNGCERYWQGSLDQLSLDFEPIDAFNAYFHDAPVRVTLSCGGATLADHELFPVSCVHGE